MCRCGCCRLSSSAATRCRISSATRRRRLTPDRSARLRASACARTRRRPPCGFARCWPTSSASAGRTIEVDHARGRSCGRRAGSADGQRAPPATRSHGDAARRRHRCRHRRSEFRPVSASLPVVPDPEAACRAWQRRHGAPDAQPRHRGARNACRGRRRPCASCSDFPKQSRACGTCGGPRRRRRLDFRRNRRNLEVAIAVAAAQGLLARPLTVDDLVTDAWPRFSKPPAEGPTT